METLEKVDQIDDVIKKCQVKVIKREHLRKGRSGWKSNGKQEIV